MASNGQGFVCIYDTALTANDATAKDKLGVIRVEQDATNGEKHYKYVQASGAIANGDILIHADATGTKVGVNAQAEGLGGFAGVGIGTITDAYYGWVQVYGYHAAIKKTTGITCTANEEQVITSNGISDISDATAKIPAGIVALSGRATGCTTNKGYIKLF